MESNTWCPRLTAWIILSGSAVHVKGFGLALCSMTKRLIAACKSTTDRKMARFNCRFVSLAKKPSTTFEPGCRCRREVEGPAGMPGQPLAYLRMPVGCVVVDDGVDLLSR